MPVSSLCGAWAILPRPSFSLTSERRPGGSYTVAQTFKRRERLIESILGGQRSVADVAPSPHVPLSEMRRRITGPLKRPRDGRCCRIEIVAHAQLAVALTGVEIGIDEMTRRALARSDAHA